MNPISKYIAYLKDNPNHYWFKAKLYGWGWVPVTWQGWAVIILYVAAVTLCTLTIDEHSSTREVLFTLILPTLFLTTLLIRVCYKTGERPRWRWGLSDTKK